MLLKDVDGKIVEISKGELYSALVECGEPILGVPPKIILAFHTRYLELGGNPKMTVGEVDRIMPKDRMTPKELHWVKTYGKEKTPITYELGYAKIEGEIIEHIRKIGVRLYDGWRDPNTLRRLPARRGECYEELDFWPSLDEARATIKSDFLTIPPRP